VCRALRVLCVAADRGSLAELKRSTVSADWELAPGAIDEDQALEQLEQEHPHVLVVFGPYEDLIAVVRERSPAVRVVTDRDLPGADVVATSLEEVRDAVRGRARPGGPVRS
jgi:hypothetical protein